MSRGPLLHIRDLSIGFRTGPEQANRYLLAVDRVSLRVPHRTSVGIVGESGSGKSVTALSILRLLPEPPSKICGGSILYRGVNASTPDGTTATTDSEPLDLTQLDQKSLQKLRGNRIAMVFQEPMTALNPVYPIGDQVGEALRTHRQLSRKQSLSAAADLLDTVGIPDAQRRARDYPHQLSGGQRQRVMIAMALSCQPDLLIADEPTTALDVTTQAQILDLLARLQAELGMALLLISHDLGVVSEVCSVVAVMYAGQIVEQAGGHELFRTPRHPYTAGLLSAVPRLHGGVERLREIPGRVPRLDEMPSGCRFADRCSRVTSLCRQQAPELRSIDNRPFDLPLAHLVRCHHPIDEHGSGACA
ncbi:MAG: ABC transporter ATP-binding protein [Polyangia bacterium]|jgi:oligopeptide/dipeptide ABC transporter ATP-binding protein